MITQALGQRGSETAYRSENVDVLVPGDQMGAFGDACRRLKLVPRQHPDLYRKHVRCSI